MASCGGELLLHSGELCGGRRRRVVVGTLLRRRLFRTFAETFRETLSRGVVELGQGVGKAIGEGLHGLGIATLVGALEGLGGFGGEAVAQRLGELFEEIGPATTLLQQLLLLFDGVGDVIGAMGACCLGGLCQHPARRRAVLRFS